MTRTATSPSSCGTSWRRPRRSQGIARNACRGGVDLVARMSSGPDLYLVCKSCGAEVSPYITECPYCGTRIQKRAPKLDRGGVPRGARKARSRPQLPRLRPGEIPGLRADRRTWAAWLLALISVIVTVGIKSGLLHLDNFQLVA